MGKKSNNSLRTSGAKTYSEPDDIKKLKKELGVERVYDRAYERKNRRRNG